MLQDHVDQSGRPADPAEHPVGGGAPQLLVQQGTDPAAQGAAHPVEHDEGEGGHGGVGPRGSHGRRPGHQGREEQAESDSLHQLYRQHLWSWNNTVVRAVVFTCQGVTMRE